VSKIGSTLIVSTPKCGRADCYGWPRLLIAVLVFALGLTLATRYSKPITSHATVTDRVERRSVEPKRQHPSPDVVGLRVAFRGPTLLTPVRLYPRVASTKVLPSREHFDQSLYKRPPPIFG
jgi:hypothetical protein